jgi:oligopeptide transport system substrate-binding protein
MWRQIYVDAEIVQNDMAIWSRMMREKEFDIGLAGWFADYNDATIFLDLLKTGNPNNHPQYSNPQYDALLDRAASERDLMQRGQLLAQAEAIALKDMPWIPASYGVNTNMVQRHVKGWVTNVNNVNHSRWLWIDEAERARNAQR